MRTILIALFLATLTGLALAADPPARPGHPDEPFFVQKESWFETVVASRQALGRPENQSRPQEQAIQAIWRIVGEEFGDSVSLAEQRLEQISGVWKDPLNPSDLAALAQRYAEMGKLQGKNAELAKSCRSIDELRVVRGLAYLKYLPRRIELAEATLALVQKVAPRPQFETQLKAIKDQLPAAKEGKVSGAKLYAEATELRRRIILSHPALDFDRLLINKRTDRLPEHMCDQYLGRHSQPATGLVVLDDWKSHPRETALVEGKLPKGALLQPDLSYDGKRVLFAFADHQTQRDSQCRGYCIYEYNIETGQVRQVTGKPTDPMEGRDGRQTVLIEDMDPCYLPDGGIAFISTRSQQFGRCHGGRYVPSYTLYRCNADGGDIRALSYNESNEWAPSILPDGSIVYCRWDYVNRHDVRFQSLWTLRPDGTQTAHYYGNNSPDPCMISEPQPIPGTRKTICTAAAHHGQTLGTLIVVDPAHGQDGGKPLTWLTPELSFPESGVPDGITRAAMPLPEDAQGGRAATPWPLGEDLYLCTYQFGDQHAIYLIDTAGGRELIYRSAGVSCFDPIPLRPRPMPPAISTLVNADQPKTGVFAIQNVYECSSPIPSGAIKRLRINQIIPQPTSNAPPRSIAENELVKKVLGTVDVAEDGSVSFEAPACTPLQFQLLDADGMAVMTMRSLVYLQPGEKASCVGCHESRASTPVPMPLRSAAIQKIKPAPGPQYAGGLSFMRTVQPVLDRHCIGCHGLDKTEGTIDLAGGSVRRDKDGKSMQRRLNWASVAYESLVMRDGLVKVAPRNGETYPSKPDDYFARAGKLARMLLAGHPDKDGRKRIELPADDLDRIVQWLDLNAQCYGDYSFNRAESQTPAGAGEKALRDAIEKRFGKELAGQPYAALVNIANIAESRILMAPLPASAGGWGQIKENAYGGVDDPAYREMFKLAEASVSPQKFHDIAGTCGRDNGCACGGCWVRLKMAADRQKLTQNGNRNPQ